MYDHHLHMIFFLDVFFLFFLNFGGIIDQIELIVFRESKLLVKNPKREKNEKYRTGSRGTRQLFI